MASTMSSISVFTPKNSLITTSSRHLQPSKCQSFRVTCQQSDSPKKPSFSLSKTIPIAGTAVATLASSPWAMAAKQIAESPQQDNRGLALLLPLVPAVGWVLFNILGPALNQVNRMRSDKAVIVGLGGGLGLALYNALYVPVASAAEVVESGGGATSSGLLPILVAGAVGLEVILFSTMQSKYEEKKE